ncbi:hypothetical protein [Desulfonema magnum]|uniref:Cohesin domain-containing protein n=1 Tax=Desulfonema magnum TaxID=45655 RepID=A0A975BIZ3_9BACT|nr:hypothetical protein [Desulfonema magnum]QTA86422.1 Cohesin domain-containing protein [Desulfonema magnum]
MFKHNFKILAVFLTSLFMAVSVSVLSAYACEINAVQGGKLRIPVALEQSTQIESVDIKVKFNQNVLLATGTELTGGILEGKGYQNTDNMNTEGEITIVISAWENVVTGSGEVVFINFDVVGKCFDASMISFETFKSSSAGGFYVNDTFCQRIKVSVICDVNDDGEAGHEEAIHALLCLSGAIQCDPDGAYLDDVICALAMASGKRNLYFEINDDGKIGIEEVIYALRCVSGAITSDISIGLEHAIYALQVVSGKSE